MALPIHTTLITVKRAAAGDAYERGAPATVVSGVRAHIGALSGGETVADGSSATVTAHLNCDPTDLRHGDVVLDESTGITYEVTWAAQRSGLGLDHTVGDLLVVQDRTAVA